MSRLWAPWRMAYLRRDLPPLRRGLPALGPDLEAPSGGAAPAASDVPDASGGCIFCRARDGDDDRAALVVQRGAHSFLILNAFPYASGHVMAVLNRHAASVLDATVDEMADAMTSVQRAVHALTVEYRAEGFNIGINQGRVAGAGIEGHLHIHVVPRWAGDANFITTVGETRVLPETLDATWERLRGCLGG